MDMRIQVWSQLYFVDSTAVLRQYRGIQLKVADSNLDDKVKN